MVKSISDQTLSELVEGGRRTREAIAQSFVSTTMAALDRTLQIKGGTEVTSEHPWDIVVVVKKDGVELHREPFLEFPSEELKAKVALVR